MDRAGASSRQQRSGRRNGGRDRDRTYRGLGAIPRISWRFASRRAEFYTSVLQNAPRTTSRFAVFSRPAHSTMGPAWRLAIGREWTEASRWTPHRNRQKFAERRHSRKRMTTLNHPDAKRARRDLLGSNERRRDAPSRSTFSWGAHSRGQLIYFVRGRGRDLRTHWTWRRRLRGSK